MNNYVVPIEIKSVDEVSKKSIKSLLNKYNVAFEKRIAFIEEYYDSIKYLRELDCGMADFMIAKLSIIRKKASTMFSADNNRIVNDLMEEFRVSLPYLYKAWRACYDADIDYRLAVETNIVSNMINI